MGVCIVGGAWAGNSRTSEFLAAGSLKWQEGTTLPVSMNLPCVVGIAPTIFLAIQVNKIHEFNSDIGGPTINESWREAGRWPTLKKGRGNQGYAKIGQKVIIAGGYVNGESHWGHLGEHRSVEPGQQTDHIGVRGDGHTKV